MRTLIFFPGALGDFLCAWPTLCARRVQDGGPITLAVREQFSPLVPQEQFACLSIDRREIADLFAAGPLAAAARELFSGYSAVHSWTGYGDPNFVQRLEAVSGGAVSVHPFRGMRAGEHAAAYVARCLGVAQVETRLHPRLEAMRWAEEFWRARALGNRILVVHPGSGSSKKDWGGMAAVAEAWRSGGYGEVVAIIGPAEEERMVHVPHDAVVRRQPLDRVAAVLSRAQRYLGNDSGISHLAGAVGARGLVLFGPSDPVTWRPLGGTLEVLHAPKTCLTCGPDRFCTHRLGTDQVREVLLEI